MNKHIRNFLCIFYRVHFGVSNKLSTNSSDLNSDIFTVLFKRTWRINDQGSTMAPSDKSSQSTTKKRWGKGRGMGKGRGGDDNKMANPATPGYWPFLKTFGFVFLSPPLCCFLFVAGKTDGPGICFTLQYLRKGFNSFP